MAQVNPYINFKGNCEEAFNFYKSVFGGEFPYVARYKEMPAGEGKEAAALDDEKIMHMSLPVSKETILMGSDVGGEWAQQTVEGNNMQLSVNTETEEEARKIFNGLSAGGRINMAMEKTFWGALFGMLTDKFGIMVLCTGLLPVHIVTPAARAFAHLHIVNLHIIQTMLRKYYLLCLLLYCSVMLHGQSVINGPLKVSVKNPRYFSDNNGKAVYLTGSHTWANLQDNLMKGDKPFDYPLYLDMMQKNGHNFMRLWMFEQPLMGSWTGDTISFDPLPFARTGPGLAKDAKPKFDLTKFNAVYFERLRNRIKDAGEKNIYVSVMLFQGWCLDRTGFKIGNPFPFLPYNATNNINRISAPETIEDYDDKPSLHSLKISAALLAVQEAYVKKVIEAVNDLDNVLYEIINEGGA